MRKRDWRVYAKKADFVGLGKKLGISPYTVRIIRNRGMVDLSEMDVYLNGSLNDLHDPHSMKHLDLAADILEKKISERKTIRIIGDYDIDGVTSITILCRGLRTLGADVSWQIPHRILDGYGMNEAMVEKAHEDGIDTLLTCDNGISAAGPVALAKSYGMTVIITDHHAIPPTGIPEADAVVDPHQEDDEYPFPDICGAVVAWKLIQIMYEKAGFPGDKFLEFLEYAAMATVGDVMPLTGENRLIVRHGLTAIHNTEKPGIQALAEASGVNVENIMSYHLGFVTGPTLNAGGRLETANLSAELLLSDTLSDAKPLAVKLHELNEDRKSMTNAAVEEGALAVETSELKNDRVLVVYLPQCHESLAGLVAGKLRERYYKPTIVLTDAADGGLKGSARSIEAYHMSDSLAEVRKLLTKFGGHPMAAGMSLPKENLEAFRKALNDNCKLTDDDLFEKCWIDIPMPLSAVSEEWVKELDRLEPFGNGNEKPKLACPNVTLLRADWIGKEKNYLRLSVREDSGYVFSMMVFNNVDDFLSDLTRNCGTDAREKLFKGTLSQNVPVKMSIMYEPGIKTYRDREEISFIMREYRF